MRTFCGSCGAEQPETIPTVLYGSSDPRCAECSLAVASEVPALAPGNEEMTYDLSPWTTGDRLALRNLLVERDVPFRWEPGLALVVHENDVVLVEEVLDLLDEEDAGAGPDLHPDASPEEEAAAHAAMDELFLVADRLARDPEDGTRLVLLEDLVGRIGDLAPPFGMEDRLWAQVRGAASTIFEVAGPGDDEDGAPSSAPVGDEAGGEPGDEVGEARRTSVAEAARHLRDLLRPYV